MSRLTLAPFVNIVPRLIGGSVPQVTTPTTVVTAPTSRSVVGPLSLVTQSLATAYPGFSFSQNIVARGGVEPYTFAITGGALPPGQTLSASGLVTGVPSASGDYSVSITVYDATGASLTRVFTGTVPAIAGAGLALDFTPDFTGIPGDAPPGTYITTASVTGMSSPVLTVLTTNGYVTIGTGNTVLAGPTPLDFTLGGTGTIKFRVQDGTNSLAIEKTYHVPVIAPSGHGTFPYDANYVTGVYVGGAALSDIVYSQAQATSRVNHDGSAVNFSPNQVQRTDLGLWISSASQTHLELWTLQPAGHWGLPLNPYTATTTITADPGRAAGVWTHPALISTDQSFPGGVLVSQAASPSIGQDVIVKVAAYHSDDAQNGIHVWMTWDGGFEGYYINGLNGAGFGIFNDQTFGNDGPNAHVISSVYDAATGYLDTAIHFVPPAANGQVFISRGGGGGTDGSQHTVGIGGCMIVPGAVNVPWSEALGTPLTTQPDYVTNQGATFLGFLRGATGSVRGECQDVAYNADGTMTANLLSVLNGGTRSVRASVTEPTQAAGPNGVPGEIGFAGFAGICKWLLTWDDAGGGVWAFYVNGAKVTSGTGHVLRTGLAELGYGATMNVRRLSANGDHMTDVEAMAATEIRNRVFANPRDAWTSQPIHQTKYEGFDTSPLKRRGPWGGTTGDVSGYYLASYNANHALWLMDRSFFSGSDASGVGNSVINNEAEYYEDIDAYQDGMYPANVLTFAGGEMIIQCIATASLTTQQQAMVPVDNHTGAQHEFVSAIVSSYASDPNSGWEQQYGVFESVMRLPGFRRCWAAVWLFCPNSGEIDFDETYGENLKRRTFSTHGGGDDTQARIKPWPMNATYHSFIVNWTHAGVDNYLDGKYDGTNPSQPLMDVPMHVMWNLAVEPGSVLTGADLAVVNAQDYRSQLRVRRWIAHQFS